MVAGVLAAIWLLAGILGLYFGFAQHRWIALVAGTFAVGYGVLWASVARTGRPLRWPARQR